MRDAAWLKSYVASSFLVVKETLQAAIMGLGPTKQPLPGFVGAPAAGAVEYGRVSEAAAGRFPIDWF